MAIFPASPLPIKVELLLNGSWTDISSYVYQRDTIVITRGRPNESSVIQPGSMLLTLNNRDGRFSPKNTSSPYYPYLVRNTQIRLSVTATSNSLVTYSGYRFWGEVSKWPPQWDLTGSDVYVQIQSGGILRRYVQGKLLGSSLRRFYMLKSDATAPVAYWPCEEGVGATHFSNLIVPGEDMTWAGGPPTLASDTNFAGSDPGPLISNSTLTGITGSYSASSPQTFSTPGSYLFTAPGGITSVNAQCWGAGGGGSDGNDDYSGGSGGGGGHFGANSAVAVTPGNNYHVTVGAGGSGGSGGGDGSDGADSSFIGDASATVTGHGGAGALANPQFPGAAGGVTIVKIFKSTGTWQAPAGVTSIKAECWGAGGGGASAGSGGGAGGGEYAAEATLAVTAGNTYNFTVGAGGSPGSPGSAGGNSTFVGDAVTVTAHGGTGGGTSSAGSGGTGSTNTTHFNGGAGGASGGVGGGGGSSGGTASAGNAGQAGSLGGNRGNAVTGGGPGGGNGYLTPPVGPGGGGDSGGGNGFQGMVRITYTVTAPATSFAGGPGGAGFLDTGSGQDGGGGGGSSGGTAAVGNAGSTATGSSGASGGTAVAGGGAGGSGGSTNSSGVTPSPPGGGGGGSGDSGASAGNGAAGKVVLSFTSSSTPNNVVLRFLLDIPLNSTPADGTVLMRGVIASGSLTKVECYYSTASGGKLSITGWNGASKLFDSAGAGITGVAGTQLMVSLELAVSGTSLAWKIDSIKPGASTSFGNASGSLATSTIGAMSQVVVAPSGGVNDTCVMHIVVQYALEALSAVSPSINGHNGESAASRFTRLCSEQGFMGSIQGNPQDTALMGPQTNKTFIDLLQEIEDADRGQLIESTSSFGMIYRTRVSMQNLVPSATFNYANATLSDQLLPVYDDQQTRNDVTVSRPNGSSANAQLDSGPLSTQLPPNGVGDYTYTPQINVNSDSQLANLAAWILNVGTVDQYRYPQSIVDLTRQETSVSGIFDATPGLGVGDYFQITNPPSWIPESPVKQLAFGFYEVLNSFAWKIYLNGVPELPYETALNPNIVAYVNSSSTWSAGGGGGSVASTASPPAGAPYPVALAFTSTAAGAGNAFENGAPQGAASLSTQYVIAGWFYSPATNIVLIANWLNSGAFVSSGSQSFTVTPNTWTYCKATFTSPASGINQIAPGFNVSGQAVTYTCYGQHIVATPATDWW